MATNPTFNFFNSRIEQNLVEDLMVETIKNFGFDCYYLPNINDAKRNLFYGEDPLRAFNTSYTIEAYLEDPDAYIGEEEYFSKFGLEIRNNLNVLMARRSWERLFPQNYSARPREGDLVYIPFSGASGKGELYEIKFVRGNKDFFVLGRKNPYFYQLQLEKFKYSNEMVSTGIPEVDRISNEGYQITLSLGAGAGNFQYKEVVFQGANLAFANATAEVNTWDSANLKLNLTFITGDFLSNVSITGANSNASYVITFFDPIEDNHTYDIYDNSIIKSEGNTFIVTTETNPGQTGI